MQKKVDAKATTKAADVKAAETKKAEVKEAAKTVKEVASVKLEEVKEAAKTVKEAAPAKKEEKKPAAKKAAAKTTAKKPAVKAESKTQIIVQYQNNEVDVIKLEEKVKAQFVAEGHRAGSIKSLNIYVKPEEYAAYYVINEKFSGRVDLF